MRVTRFEDAGEFLEAVGDQLLRYEAENCLMLGICHSLLIGKLGPEKPYLVGVFERNSPVCAAIRTPPRDLVLSYAAPSAAIERLAEVGVEDFPELPGVLGERECTDEFADMWAALREVEAERFRAERIYKASEVDAPDDVVGEARRVGENHRDLLERWLESFWHEVGETPDRQLVIETAEGYLSDELYGAAIWWIGDAPVSFAALSGPTKNGIRVNAVYTPPEQRGRGYGSAITAAVTQYAFDKGRRFCCLFTDLSNPTSNRIYQRIGYRPLCDISHYRFRE